MSADSNKVSEDIENAKATQRVTFAENVVDHGPAITHSFEAKKQPSHSNVRKNVFRCLREGKNEEVKNYFNSDYEMRTFYNKEGKSIFSWAITSISDDTPLNYLVNNLPKDIVRESLLAGTTSILANFVSSQKLMDQYGYSTEETKAETLRKLTIILKMNDPEINEVIKNNATENIRRGLTLTM